MPVQQPFSEWRLLLKFSFLGHKKMQLLIQEHCVAFDIAHIDVLCEVKMGLAQNANLIQALMILQYNFDG